VICGKKTRQCRVVFHAPGYDLDATLDSGQAFRWQHEDGAWVGIVKGRWVRLVRAGQGIRAETVQDVTSWDWLSDYLQVNVRLDEVIAAFPTDKPLQEAVAACSGLRLLRQDPWECLASFILSSTKQIVQIKQIVGLLCERFGEPVAAPASATPAYAFPTATALAKVSEAELRRCKMGFRAPYLLAAAQAVARGELNLSALAGVETEEARTSLITLPGVGRKIADCVLLFAYGRQDAFPVDVWVSKALRELYFPEQLVTPKHLLEFSRTHFGPYAGYAQQYLFHYMRTRYASAP